jgi:hypothetical protein
MRKIVLLALLLLSVSLRAEDFKILFINTESIKIGKTTRVAGDVFSDAEKIYWKDGKQAMKVLSLDTKKQYVLVSEDFRQRKLKSAKDFIVKNNRLSTRGIGNLSSVAALLGDRIYWLNPTLITIEYEPEEGEFFFLKAKDEEIKLDMDGQQLILDERIWGASVPSQIETDLYFHYKDGENELVDPGVLIIPLPNEIHLKKR